MPSNRAPIAKILGPTSVRLGKITEIDASGSTDPDGTIKKWGVEWGDGDRAKFVGKPGQAEHQYAAAGKYKIVLTVYDNKQAADSAKHVVEVVDEHQAPRPVDCVLSDWTLQSAAPWGACRPDGTQTRTETWTRTVVTEPAHGGAACGQRSEERTASQACVYVPPPPPSDHAYFDALVARPEHRTSCSLRDPSFFAGNQWVTYDPAQDAAKVVVPAFFLNEPTHVLTHGLDAAGTVLTIQAGRKAVFPGGRTLKIDDEILAVASGGWVSETTVTVIRGALGTTPQPHAVGAQVLHSTNSLRSQVRLPLMTEDGHTYLIGIDVRWDRSYMGAGRFDHKLFQLSSGSQDGDAIWLEPHVSYQNDPRDVVGWDPTTHVAAFTIRPYNKSGGDPNWSLTDGNTLGPGGLGPRTDFCIVPEIWTRLVLRLRQQANDYDVLDCWLLDETREAVPVYANGLVSVRPTGRYPNQIAKFWIEFNSSTDELLRPDQRDLVAHVRNFWVLIDPPDDVSAVLVRP